MAEPIAVKAILSGAFESKHVKVRGWIYRTRGSGKLAFVVLRDPTGIIQSTVAKDNVAAADFENAKKALVESAVEVRGKIVSDERAPGGYEIQADAFKVLNPAAAFPITEYQSEELLLDNRHLWIRSQKLTNVMKVKAGVLRAARDWFAANDFYEVTPPTITSNACEGGTTLFEFDYFGMPAYLSQSAQLYLEALIFSLGNVWSLTPSFRAERSKTRRHLTEYWHLEAEEAWVGSDGNMQIQEQLISHICQSIATMPELQALGRDKGALSKVEPPFPRIKYENVVDILQGKGFEFEYGMDFGAKEERALTEAMEIPIFVTDFPKTTKPFYMKENPADDRTYLCSDLLAPEGYGEIIGGSERETSADKLVERLNAENVNLDNYKWYIDLRRYGSVQHSGFGLGIERLLVWLCKLEHIRDAMPFPRSINRVYP